MRVYAAIDDQSNRTLATPELLDQVGIQGKHAQFNMSSCSGNSTLTGRLANNICVGAATEYTSTRTVFPQERPIRKSPHKVVHLEVILSE
jgi:hypothetical protein